MFKQSFSVLNQSSVSEDKLDYCTTAIANTVTLFSWIMIYFVHYFGMVILYCILIEGEPKMYFAYVTIRDNSGAGDNSNCFLSLNDT